MAETVLSRRVRHQPVPHLNPGGDCGPCVLAGLLGWEPREVYERLRDGKVESVGYYEMREVLRAHPELFDRTVTAAPLGWDIPEALRAFGNTGHLQSLAWFDYVRMALDAGYYGIANVSYRKGGPAGDGCDHWVLICGARERHPESGVGRVWQEVLVSCSAKSSPDEEWVDKCDFLRERGGFNLLLARPR